MPELLAVIAMWLHFRGARVQCISLCNLHVNRLLLLLLVLLLVFVYYDYYTCRKNNKFLIQNGGSKVVSCCSYCLLFSIHYLKTENKSTDLKFERSLGQHEGLVVDSQTVIDLTRSA